MANSRRESDEVEEILKEVKPSSTYFNSKRTTSYQDEVLLIEMVKKRPLIYKKNNKSVSDINAKEMLWKEIEELLQKPVAVLKRQWKSLRDYYTRNSRKMIAIKAGLQKPTVDMDRMNLLEFLECNRNGDSHNDGDSFLYDVDIKDEIDLSNDESDIQNGCTNIESVLSVELVEGSDSGTPKKRTSEKNSESENPKEMKRARVENVAYRSHHRTDIYEYAIDAFFNGLSETVKTFSPEMRIEAKRKLFNVVSELEEAALNERM